MGPVLGIAEALVEPVENQFSPNLTERVKSQSKKTERELKADLDVRYLAAGSQWGSAFGLG